MEDKLLPMHHIPPRRIIKGFKGETGTNGAIALMLQDLSE